MKLDPERLRTLSTVLRTGSFEAAANEMRITQSAVSQRIKLLEENVGAQGPLKHGRQAKRTARPGGVLCGPGKVFKQ